MTEENTLPENGWAIRATRETKKHPKWDVMTNSINLLNAHIENDAWVGMDMDGNVRNGDFGPQSFTYTVITMNDWCDMNNLSRTNPTLEEEINALEPEFDPDKPIEVSDDELTWYPVDASKNKYLGIGMDGKHVFQEKRGEDILTYDEFTYIRNYKDFNAGMLGVGDHMIVKDPVALHLEDHLLRMTVDRRLFDMDADSLLTDPDYLYIKGKRVNVKLEVTDV